MMNGIQLLVASSVPMIRDGLRGVIEAEADFVLVGEVDNSYAAQQVSQQTKPDVLLLHESLAGATTEALVQVLLTGQPRMKILLLADTNVGHDAHTLVTWGVGGRILLEESNLLLTQAIRTVGLGGVWFSRDFIRMRAAGAGSVEERLVATYKLTKSELAVTRLVADGMSNKEIAALVDVKERTVEFHMTNIIQKLRVSNRTGVAVRVKELE